jgi:TonB family protein
LLEIAHLHDRRGSAISFDSSANLPAPRLALESPGTREEFFSSLVALVRGQAPEKFQGAPYFRDCWIEAKFPRSAFVAAVALQAALIAFPPPIWSIRPARAGAPEPRTEIAWYGPAKDFPLILPPLRVPRPAARREAKDTPLHRGADAFHPRQTILSAPLHPMHPRQVLIQPKAAQEPPKILPALPNIVQLAAAQPERPKLQLTAKELVSLRPTAPARLLASNALDAPEISAMENQPGAINIAASPQSQSKPVMPVKPMSVPRAAREISATNAAAPEIAGGTGAGETLIALSAAPAPVAPPPAMPAGNLSARVSISPDGPQPGAPGIISSGDRAPGGQASGGGRGPEGIFISGGSGANASPISGPSISPTARGAGYPLPSRPMPRPRVAAEDSGAAPSVDAGALAASAKLGISPEKVLGSKRVYTMHVNMPNLTSASGSWVLNFAELSEALPGGGATLAVSDLAAPVPLRKVDPKYPPELRASHVDGEVILYAIIRKDGTVDSIQLVHSVDPHLDANAMEALAQWKFQPAEKHGEAVDLEAVVHIPFRSRGPAF